MRNVDFSSWEGLLSTLLGLCVVTLVMVGIRLVVMQTVQQRRERENRQINERLRTLIAAYKTLGGSFTGNLAVDPAHKRDLRASDEGADAIHPAAGEPPGAERRRRMRDAVEAALSDVILLGTELQVRLAVKAASELVEGRPVEIAELVVSLREFIREVLDLDPIPAGMVVPRQGPVRPFAAASRGASRQEGGESRGGGRGAGGQGGGGAGIGMGSSAHEDHAGDESPHR
jgi:hypothetical protein